jgi:hypothetical protein
MCESSSVSPSASLDISCRFKVLYLEVVLVRMVLKKEDVDLA